MYNGAPVLAPTTVGLASLGAPTLAFTGFAFALYLAIAVGLIGAGLVLRIPARSRGGTTCLPQPGEDAADRSGPLARGPSVV